jgi:hypothetical protein
MVSGIVRPPAIDLANRDLIDAHLHAVWMAESGQMLEGDIPHVLDLNETALPIRKDVAATFDDPKLTTRAATSMQRILAAVKDTVPWAQDRDALANSIATDRRQAVFRGLRPLAAALPERARAID